MRRTPKRYYTSTEAAALLMVSPVTIREWARKGLLQAVSTAGGHRRFLLETLQAFAAAHGIRFETGDVEFEIRESRRVLIVDDDAAFAIYLRQIIRAADPTARIEMASDGFEAGQYTEALRPHLVALDLHMPRVDGIQLCRRLRSSSTTASARLVLLSGALTAETAAAAVAAGADECVEKGSSRADILRALRIEVPPPPSALVGASR